MILIDNRYALRLKNRELLNRLSAWDNLEPTGQVITEQAKTGALTLKLVHDEKMLYLQSKYDPKREAQRFASKFDEEIIKHVLFVGVGAGYHIQAFMEAHPDTKFSIYEPNEEVLHAYLSNFQLDDLPLRQLAKIFTGTEEESVTTELQVLLAASKNVLKIITLPVYEKIFGEQIQVILEKSLESIKEKHSSLATNVSFQKRWTINSIKNFPTVLKTPNILHDIDRSSFEGKPAIIVAAGPSLNEEFENLRYIKENGLAYIFSVGSAINALIEQGIYPDAACTYDPQDINYRVIQIIKDKGITEIPLVFGTSVGFETLENYRGELLHMIVSQDTVAPALLKSSKTETLDFVNDAPSIAVVTFQLLSKLGCSPIILAGQNLAYIRNHYYAKGIDYGNNSHEVKEEALNKAIATEDVYGQTVKTTDGFNRMRQQLEMYIAHYPSTVVFNTTKGGAAINGTTFSTLEDLIANYLSERVISMNWYYGESHYDETYLSKRLVELTNESQMLNKIINSLLDILRNINSDLKMNRTYSLENKYTKLDSYVADLKKNHFYNSFVDPMIRVQYEVLTSNILGIQYQQDPIKKGKIIVQEFSRFVEGCARNSQVAYSLFNEMKDSISHKENEVF